MKFMSTALLLLHFKWYLSDSKSYELKLGSSYSGSVKSGQDTYFKLVSNNNAFQSANIPNNQLYVSLTLCSSPGNDAADPDIFFSTTDSTPGPNKGEKLRNNFTAENYPYWKSFSSNGFPKGIVLSTIATKPKSSDINIYLAVSVGGNNLEYKYQLAVNTVNYYHNYSPSNGLVLLDTDDTSASFSVLSNDPSKFDKDTQTLYYRPSGDYLYTACSLQANNSTASSKSDSSKIKMGGKLPSQFMGTEALISDLNRGTSYDALLVNNNPSGTTTFNIPVRFKTSKYSDCKLMNQLKFCDMVSYSVPLPNEFIIKENNSTSVSLEKVKKTYDDYASGMYKKFQTLIDQYDCEAHIYSPVRNCTDCQSAYKDWLCAMTFPRCSDELHGNDSHKITAERHTHDKTKEHLPDVLRDVNTYHEIKPCIDLCYYVIQSCPVAFEFTCPESKSTLNYTYGQGTMEFTNITAWQPMRDSIGSLPFGCNNMMRPVASQGFSQFSYTSLISLLFFILTIFTYSA